MNIITKLKYLLHPHKKHWFCIKEEALPCPLERGKWYSISSSLKKGMEEEMVLESFTIKVKEEK